MNCELEKQGLDESTAKKSGVKAYSGEKQPQKTEKILNHFDYVIG